MRTELRTVMKADLDRCYEIESLAYPQSEAASKANILKRLIKFPEGFLVLKNEKEIMGFINSGATNKVVLSDERFKELVGHDKNGKHIVIMSVVLHPDYQKKGYSSLLMKAFIQNMKALKKEEIYFICKEELLPLYEKFGYQNLGLSSSSHGGASWFEMSLSL